MEIKLKENNIQHVREQKVDLSISGQKIGHHYIDFMIEHKIILELKKGNITRIGDIKQLLMYLKSANIKLGILAYFGNAGVNIKRVINSSYVE